MKKSSFLWLLFEQWHWYFFKSSHQSKWMRSSLRTCWVPSGFSASSATPMLRATPLPNCRLLNTGLLWYTASQTNPNSLSGLFICWNAPWVQAQGVTTNHQRWSLVQELFHANTGEGTKMAQFTKRWRPSKPLSWDCCLCRKELLTCTIRPNTSYVQD